MSPYIIEKLSKDRHDREKFNCGIDVLNTYLKTRANQEQKKRLNITYVMAADAKTDQNPIIGYYTLSNSAIKPSAMDPELTQDIPPTYDIPSIKIGRLAIDMKFQNKGMGSLLLKDAFIRILEIATLSGIRGIEVIAKNENAASFYKKFGFLQLIDATNLLFLPITTVINALKS